MQLDFILSVRGNILKSFWRTINQIEYHLNLIIFDQVENEEFFSLFIIKIQ